MWFWITIMLGLNAIAVRRAYRYTRMVRLVNQTPVGAIKDLKMGFAVVEGKVFTECTLLKSPLTGQSCVAYGVTVAVPGEDADIARCSQSIPYGIDDGTGRVELEHGKLLWNGVVTLDHDGESTPPAALTERVRLLFPDIEERSAGGDLATSSMMCVETIVGEGAQVCVAGQVHMTPSGYRMGKGKFRAVARPTRAELLQALRSTALAYWVSAGAMIATAFLVPSIYSYKPELVWVVGFYALPIMGWFLWDRVSV